MIRPRLAAAALALLVALPAFAQQKQAAPAAGPLAPPSVAIVDVQEVLRKAKAGAALRDEVENQRSSFERDLEKLRGELRTAEEQLRRQQSVLSPEALEQRRRDLERRANDARRETEERQNALNKVFNQAMGKLREEMARAVAEVMQGKAVTLVLPRATVLVYDEKMNITNDVIVNLDKRLPKVPLNFGGAAPRKK